MRGGRYRTDVDRSGRDQEYRIRAGSTTSRARTVAARVQVDACGTQPRKADGSLWSCTFVDDFSGATLNRSTWVPQSVFSTGDVLSGYACYDTDPSVVSVSGGTLNLSVRKNATDLPCVNGQPATPYCRHGVDVPPVRPAVRAARRTAACSAPTRWSGPPRGSRSS